MSTFFNDGAAKSLREFNQTAVYFLS